METIDLTKFTDIELGQLAHTISEERTKRTSLANIKAQFDRINADFLAAQGVEQGSDWRQPDGGHDAYPAGWVVAHKGKQWQSLIPSNVWEPGVSAWREVASDGQLAAWVQPLGAHDAYLIDDLVTFDNKAWRSTVSGNAWQPGVYGWVEVEQEAPEEPVDPEPEEPVDPEPPVDPEEPEEPEEPLPAPAAPEWKQPTGAHDSYALGALVTYKAKTWRNTMAGNSYSPDVYGWVVVP